jgi:LmbE family N-acetylglucosaminyl deacetylase
MTLIRRWRIGVAFVVLTIAVLGTLAVLTEWRRRHALYWYDVTADYRFELMGPDVQRIPVSVSSTGFELPEWTRSWDTAFLRLSVRSTTLGTWFEPAIDVRHRDGACRQHFERRAAGQRYLNLCLDSATTRPGGRITLNGEYLHWPDQEAEILLFSNEIPVTSRLLVIAPHADDAEIAAFGLYARRDSWIVTVTNGGYGGAAYRDLIADPNERDSLHADLRVWDSMAGPIWAGLPPDRAISLGYFTLTLESMYRYPTRIVPNPITGSTDITRWRRGAGRTVAERPAVSTWESLVSDLAGLLNEIEPDVVLFPHPAFDANRDHVFTAAAVLEALGRAKNPSRQLLLYANHHARTEYYPFGPADTTVTLPPWFDDAVPVRAVLSHPLDRERQLAKLFALDAMHDLRPAPQPVAGGVTGRIFRRITEALADVARDPARELSYFRRAPRPNEIFFRYTADDRRRLEQLLPARVEHGTASAPLQP